MQYCKRNVFGAKIVVHMPSINDSNLNLCFRNYEFPYKFEDFLEENEKMLDSFIGLDWTLEGVQVH